MKQILKSSQGIAHIALVLFLFISIPATLYLVYQTQIFRPKAYQDNLNSLQTFNNIGVALSTYQETDFGKSQTELKKKIEDVGKGESLDILSTEEAYERLYGQDRKTLLKEVFDLPEDIPDEDIDSAIKNALSKVNINVEGEKGQYEVMLPEGCYQGIDSTGMQLPTICSINFDGLFYLGSGVVEFLFGDIISLYHTNQKDIALAKQVTELFEKSGINERVNTTQIDTTNDNDLTILSKFLQADLENYSDDSLTEEQRQYRNELIQLFPSYTESYNNFQNEAKNIYVLGVIFGAGTKASEPLLTKLATTPLVTGIADSIRSNYYKLTGSAHVGFERLRDKWVAVQAEVKSVFPTIVMPKSYPAEDEKYWKIIAKLTPQGFMTPLSPDETRPVVEKLISTVQGLIDTGLVQGVAIDRKKVLEVVNNRWIMLAPSSLLDQEFKLGKNSAGVAFSRTVVLEFETADMRNLDNRAALSHEFVHIINKILIGRSVPQGKYFNYGGSGTYNNVMTILYERGTDEVAEVSTGAVASGYKGANPGIYQGVDALIDYLSQYSNGRFNRSDLMSFALTSDDTIILKKIFGVEDPKLFVDLFEGKINFGEVERIYQARKLKEQEVREALLAASGVIGSDPLVNSGSQPNTEDSLNSDPEESVYIYPPYYPEDADILTESFKEELGL